MTRLTIKDLSRKQPGLVQFRVQGQRGAYPVDPATLPLTGFLVLDPPTAETGQCGRAAFPGPAPSCALDGGTLRCK